MDNRKLKKIVVRDGNALINSTLLSGENMRELLGGYTSCPCNNCANLSCFSFSNPCGNLC